MIRKNGSPVLLFPLLLATLFWAFGHPLGRIILQTVHPFQLGTMTLSSRIPLRARSTSPPRAGCRFWPA